MWAIANSTYASEIEKHPILIDAPTQSITDRLILDPKYTLFTTALRRTSLWELLRSAEKVILFVPSDVALNEEGSAFLLERVLLARENKARLESLMSQHLVLGNNITLEKPYKKQRFVSYSGECIIIKPEGDRLKVAADAFLLDIFEANNGTIFFIDRLLWTPYKKQDLCVGDK